MLLVRIPKNIKMWTESWAHVRPVWTTVQKMFKVIESDEENDKAKQLNNETIEKKMLHMER